MAVASQRFACIGLKPSSTPVLLLQARLGLVLASAAASGGGSRPSVALANALARAVERAVLGASLGTLVEVVGANSSSDAAAAAGVAQAGRGEVILEVTLFMCKENATVPSPRCEEQVGGREGGREGGKGGLARITSAM